MIKAFEVLYENNEQTSLFNGRVLLSNNLFSYILYQGALIWLGMLNRLAATIYTQSRA